ncbi:MAG: hypothetical protein H0V01_05560 [Bacteroidetes bacterium]|nr:hypothetical protein [Bacteroidota bacterium]HET6243767.1 hypothetical protein [Bacteroidia bacterium]
MEAEIKNLPKDIGQKILIVVKNTKSIFQPLKSYDYVLEKIEFDKSLVIKYALNIIYSNHSANRKIIIHYEPIDIENKSIDMLTLHIIKMNDSEKEIEFYRFLKKCDIQIDLDTLLYINHDKSWSFKENTKVVLKLNLLYLTTLAENIITGKKWEEGLKFKWDEQLEKMIYEEQKNILYKDNKQE